MIQKFINWFFRFENNNGHGAVEKYKHRWCLLKLWGGRAVYLHHYIGSDWSSDPHDHPKKFVSIGLWGSYLEWTPGPMFDLNQLQCKIWIAPWYRSFPSSHVHLITMLDPSCWTLVYVGKYEQSRGFWERKWPGVGSFTARWMHWTSYVYTHAGRAK